MALVLDTTVGGSQANAYLSRAEANAYFDTRLYASAWTGATDAVKDAAIVWATRLLDRMVEWEGGVWSTTQALRWPRSYVYDADGKMLTSDVIPRQVKEATAELAIWLIQKDRTAETGREGIRAFAAGKVSFEFDKTDTPPVIPDAVYQLLVPLGVMAAVSSKSGVGMSKLVRV